MKAGNLSALFCTISILILLVSCSEEYPYRFTQEESTIVIEGCITDAPGPYFVRVTRSSNYFLFSDQFHRDFQHAKPVNDAIVIIGETEGEEDTLIHSVDSVPKYYYLHDSVGNITDTVLWDYEIPEKSSIYGFYQTTKIRGVAGKTYFLKVMADGQSYKAVCSMPSLPSVDSLGFKEIVVKEADGSTAWVPILYFKDPPYEKNYYLFTIHTYNYGWWIYSILDDRYIDPLKKGITMDDGFHPNWWRTNYFVGIYSESECVSVESLTSEGFEYYRNLIQQFNNDGGAYSPSPSSPRSNFNNGALGLFRASSIHTISGMVPIK
jgi:hypothetical protein